MEDFLQQRPVNADAPKGSCFGPSCFLNTNDLSLNIIHNTSINHDNNARYSEYNQASE